MTAPTTTTNTGGCLDATRGGTLSLSKAFLSVVAGGSCETRDFPARGLEAYKKYFLEYTLLDADANLSALERFGAPGDQDSAVWDTLYRTGDPGQDPDWFSFWSHQDVNRAGNLYGLEPVVYVDRNAADFCPLRASGAWLRNRRVEFFHDFRWTSDDRRRVYFLLTRDRRLYVLDSGLADYYDSQAPRQGMPFERVRTVVGPDSGGCASYEAAFRLLLGRPRGDDDEEEDDGAGPRRPLDFFTVDERSLFERVNALCGGGVHPFLVVAFGRNTGRSSMSSRGSVRPRGCFTTLAVVSPVSNAMPFSDRVKSRDDCQVVCLYGRGMVCLLAESWRRYVVATHFSTTGLKETLSNRRLAGLGSVKKKPSSEAASERARAREEKKRKTQRRMKCKCETCSRSKDYDNNMDRSGPERLCSTPYTVADLLQIMGIGEREGFGSEALERVCELSVAAMDIESKTQEVDLVTPRPGPGVEYAEIDSAVLEGHYKKVQTPVMIAHTDALTQDATWHLTSAGDEPRHAYEMMAAYWSRVLERRQACADKKNEICAPVFELLRSYNRAFVAYYNEFAVECAAANEADYQEELARVAREWTWADESGRFVLEEEAKRTRDDTIAKLPLLKNMHAAWRATIPGQLETALHALAESYTVFSFCGAGYDHVLLLQYLVPHLYETKQKPAVQKKGNRVTTITAHNRRVTFRDVSKLLAPSTSLRKFGELFRLDQCKAHFPFAILRSVDDLQRTELPTDNRWWRSELGGAGVGLSDDRLAEMKAEAQRLFEAARCSNLGDYLRAYLLLDVEILYKATQGWRRQLKDTIGLDFVDVRKFTISSLSYTAGLKKAERRLRLGQFFPNNSQMYRILRKGMRG